MWIQVLGATGRGFTNRYAEDHAEETEELIEEGERPEGYWRQRYPASRCGRAPFRA